MDEIVIRRVTPDQADLRSLIERLDDYLFGLYPPDEVFRLDLADPSMREVEFVVAYLDEMPVGCGAIRRLDETTAELKRFYVRESYRNRGIAGRVLTCLEQQARVGQFERMRLETGNPQVESVGFYKKHGYYEIERYGEYIDCPSSLCFEKRLREKEKVGGAT